MCRAYLHAAAAVLVFATQTDALVYACQSHAYLLERRFHQGAAGAGAHAEQAVAGYAGLVVGIDKGSAGQ